MTEHDQYKQKERIRFRVGPTGKTFRNGTYHGLVPNHPGTVLVQLDGDPYAIVVDGAQVSKMSNNVEHESDETTERNTNMTTATPTKVTAKDLRRKAKTLGVEGWEEMTSAELKAAIGEAEKGASTEKSSTRVKSTTRRARATAVETDEDAEVEEKVAPKSKAKAAPAKAASSKAKARAAAVAEDGDEDTVNPYKAGSNLYFITEELLKGGKRSAMVKRLQRKIELKPRQRAGDDYDVEAELDRRVLIVGQLLERDHGFVVTREGRGKDALIKAEKE